MLWFVVNTDLTITTKKVNDLFSTVEYDWGDVAEFRLNLPKSKRSEIDRNFHSPAQRKEAYIDIYVNEHPHPTWKQLSQALRALGRQNKAAEVENTYVQGIIIHRHRCTLCTRSSLIQLLHINVYN